MPQIWQSMAFHCWMPWALNGEAAVVWPDKRREYDEARMVALGYIGLRIMAVVFVDRPPEQPAERRIISLRKANTREVKRYAET